jgi:uncharacterized membrane protein
VNAILVAVGVALAVLGARSLWKWFRTPLDSGSPSDHLLYALYVTGRVGLWFAFAAVFVGYAVIDDIGRFRWFVLIPIVLSAMQLLGGVLLGRPSAER